MWTDGWMDGRMTFHRDCDCSGDGGYSNGGCMARMARMARMKRTATVAAARLPACACVVHVCGGLPVRVCSLPYINPCPPPPFFLFPFSHLLISPHSVLFFVPRPGYRAHLCSSGFVLLAVQPFGGSCLWPEGRRSRGPGLGLVLADDVDPQPPLLLPPPDAIPVLLFHRAIRPSIRQPVCA